MHVDAQKTGWLQVLPPRFAWREDLAAWAHRRLGAPFAWGQTDCLLLVLEAIDVQTSGRHAEAYRGRYHSLLGAMRFQLERGTLADGMLAHGWHEVAPHDAGYGDVVLVDEGAFVCGHVCFGERCLSASPEHGVRWTRSEPLLEHASCTVLTFGGRALA
jgi:hypothetical protein